MGSARQILERGIYLASHILASRMIKEQKQNVRFKAKNPDWNFQIKNFPAVEIVIPTENINFLLQ